MNIDEILQEFRKDLRPAVHGTLISEHPALKQLSHEMIQFTQFFSRKNSDLEEKLSQGQILLGYAIDCDFLPDGTPIRIPARSLTQGVLTVGMIGSGKTNSNQHLINQIRQIPYNNDDDKITYSVFDIKGDYLNLAKIPDTHLIRPETFYWNPLRHLERMHNWFEQFTEALISSMDLRGVSGGTLIQTFKHELSEFRAKRENEGEFPTLYDVFFALRRAKQRLGMKDRTSTDYLARLENRIGALLSSSIGEALGVQVGFPYEEIEKMNHVVDMRNVIGPFSNFYTDLQLAWRFEHQINYSTMDANLHNVILVDESEELILKGAGVSGIDMITRLIKMFRQMGTGFILSSHSWNALNQVPIIQGSFGTTLMMAMGNSTDAASMARAMGMSDKVFQQIQNLVPGKAICKIVGIPECITVLIPEVPRTSVIDDIDALYAKTDAYLRSRFPVKPSAPETIRLYEDMIRGELVTISGDEDFATKKKPLTTQDIMEQKTAMQDEREAEWCRIVYVNEDKTYDELRALSSFGKSREMTDRIIKKTLGENLMIEYKRALYKKEVGRPPARFSLLPDGFRLIGKEFKGYGKGPKQAPFVRHMRRYFESLNLKTSHETFYNRPDITVLGKNGEDKWLSIEISWSTNTTQEIRNLKRNLSDNFENILVIPIAMKVESKNKYTRDHEKEEAKAAEMRTAIIKEFPMEADKISVKLLDEFKL